MTDSYPILSYLDCLPARRPAGRPAAASLVPFRHNKNISSQTSSQPETTTKETMFNSLKTIFYYAPSELSGDFIHALQRLGADRGLGLAEQPRRESAATVQPPPRHLPPPGVPLR